MNKPSLRSKFRQTRNEMDENILAFKSAAIVQRLKELIEVARFEMILSFHKLGNEPDLSFLLKALPECKFGFPVIDPLLPGQMEFFSWEVGDPIKLNKFAIPEPDPRHSEKLIPDVGFMLLLPALAVTSSGIRLGYGGGFYDRYCARFPDVERVAVVFDEFVVANLPEEAHDLRVHKIITDARKIICQQLQAQN